MKFLRLPYRATCPYCLKEDATLFVRVNDCASVGYFDICESCVEKEVDDSIKKANAAQKCLNALCEWAEKGKIVDTDVEIEENTEQ